jgi:hypothetical protein
MQAIRTGWVHPNINIESPESELVRLGGCWFQAIFGSRSIWNAKNHFFETCSVYCSLNLFWWLTIYLYIYIYMYIWSCFSVRMLSATAPFVTMPKLWDLWQDMNVIVGRDKQRLDIKVALSNSFGFGGHNSSVLFAPYEESNDVWNLLSVTLSSWRFLSLSSSPQQICVRRGYRPSLPSPLV